MEQEKERKSGKGSILDYYLCVGLFSTSSCTSLTMVVVMLFSCLSRLTPSPTHCGTWALCSCKYTTLNSTSIPSKSALLAQNNDLLFQQELLRTHEPISYALPDNNNNIMVVKKFNKLRQFSLR